MIRQILVTASVLLLALPANATMIVYDPILHAQTLGDQIVDFAKWAESEIQEAETSLNTLNTYENTVLQVERMGDPKTLTANLPGIQNIQTLAAIYQQAQKDVTDLAALSNPGNISATANQILQTYKQPLLTSFTASNGVTVGPAQSLFQFQAANYNVATNSQQTIATLNQQLQTLSQQLAAATSAMQAATTQSAVQKYQATISGLHASIDAVNGAIQQAKLSAQFQTQQNNSAEQITRSAEAQVIQASDYKAIDEGLNGLPLGNLNGPVLWNQSP